MCMVYVCVFSLKQYIHLLENCIVILGGRELSLERERRMHFTSIAKMKYLFSCCPTNISIISIFCKYCELL